MTTGEKVVTMFEIQESLKPCPFCGFKPIIKEIRSGGVSELKVSAKIVCDVCGIEANFEQERASFHPFKRLYPWEQWNTRAEVQNG